MKTNFTTSTDFIKLSVLFVILKIALTSNLTVAQSFYDPSLVVKGYDSAKATKVTPASQRAAYTAPLPDNTSTTISHKAAQANSCYSAPDTSFTSFAANDDGSLGPINLGFTFNLYGVSYTKCYINNNGNVTFTAANGTYSSTGFPNNIPMVAPFWADVDTRGTGSGLVKYKLYSNKIVVTWAGVGYYNAKVSALDTFQVILTNGTDASIGLGNNVQFNYGRMNWTTGDASGGSNGFGGTAATVGISKGDNVNYVQVGRFGLNSSAYTGAANNITNGVHYLDYGCFAFNVASAANIPPSVSGVPSNDTLTLVCGSTATLAISFLPPETNQTISSSINLNGLCNATTKTTSGAVSNDSVTITAASCNMGYHTISFTGTDSYSPAGVTTVSVVIKVVAATTTAASNSPICTGSTLNITTTAVTGATYSWTGPNGFTSTLQNPTIPNATTAASGTYNITATPSGGCTAATKSVSVTITSAPNAGTISGTQAICSNGTTTFTTNGNVGGTWSSGTTGVATINASTGVITPVAAGTSTITYLVGGTGGCTTASATRTVTVTTAPNAGTLTGTQTICTGGTSTFSSNGNSDGAWSSDATNIATVGSSTGVITAQSTVGTANITYTITGTGGCANATATLPITVNIKTWNGAVSTDWNTAGNWCGGVPTASENVVIPSGASRMPSISSSVSCNNITVNSGATVTNTSAGTLNIAGSFTNSGTYTDNGTTIFNGTATQQTFSGITTFNHLTLNNTSSLLIPANTTINGNLLITAGTLIANNFNLTVKGNWTNNAGTPAFTAGTGIVTMGGTSAQAIGGSYVTSFGNLTISNASNTVSLAIYANITGDLNVAAGTFDLAGYTANRATTGGTLTVANNATLKISGIGAFPSNYTTNTLVVASTVEYAGTNQTVSNQLYGILKLSSASGAAVKTFPGTALHIVGNLVSVVVAGTSVTYSAAANITVDGDINIGSSTIFNCGTYNTTINGNWINNGTFNGNSGTLTVAGASASISGAGSQNFNDLSIAGTMVSLPSGNVNISGNLSTIGAGSFSQAAGGTFTMTGTSKTISGSSMSIENLTVTGNISCTTYLVLTGNLVVNGTFTNSYMLALAGTNKTVSGTGSINFATLSIMGSATATANFSVSTALSVLTSASFSASAGTATFTGTSTLSGTANLYNVTVNGTSLQLGNNAVLGIANALTITAGVLDATTSSPNTIIFNGTVAQSINGIEYYNLILSNGNNKTALANIIIDNSFTIGTSTTFIGGSYTHTVHKNWINNGIFTPGAGTIEFTGGTSTTIIGVTTFNIMTVNNDDWTTPVILNSNITVGTLNMTMGILITGVDTVTITSTRTGAGEIAGNIRRTHTFTTGVAYAFEGLNNTISFASVSGVNDVTVSVSQGSITDFPFGGNISKLYTIAVPAGTYNATLRIHYEHNELNGNVETSLGMWHYNGSSWINIGKTGSDTAANYVEKSGLTGITNRWTFSDASNVIQWNGSVSSNWNTSANWTVIQGSPSTPPSAIDIVDLGTATFNNQPTISTSATAKNIVFGSAKSVTLTMASGGSLTTGDINGQWTGSTVHTIDIADQTVTVNGDMTLSDGTSGHTINLAIATGTLSISGSLNQSGGANVIFSATGNLQIGANYNYVNGTFTPSTGTVTYNGSVYQVVAAVNYYNLTVNKTGDEGYIYSPTTVAGNLTLTAGELDVITTTLTINGNVNIETDGLFDNQGAIVVKGNWINNGGYEAHGTTVTFNGTGTQTIANTAFENIIINKPASSLVDVVGDITLLGDLTITSGTIDIHSYFFNRLVRGGTITITDSATFIWASNNGPDLYAIMSLSSGSTVIANGTGPQNIFEINYGNFIMRNGGHKTMVTPITVRGDLTMENGAIFDGSSFTINLYGNWVNNATFVPSTSTVNLLGTSKTLTGASTFNNMNVIGSYTLLGNNVFNGLLNVTSTGTFNAGGTINTTLHGDLINSGVLYTLGTTTYSGNVVQNLRLVNAVSTVALIVNFNGTVPPVLNSTSAPQFGYLNINNTGGINPSVGWNILYAMNVGTGASFNGGNLTHNILGSVTNNGTITSSGTLNFMPSANTTLALGSGFNSTGTVNFSTAKAITITGAAANFQNVVIANTNAVGITPPASWNISNKLTINAGTIFNTANYNHTIGGILLNNGTANIGTSTLTIGGSLTNYGTMDATAATLVFNGDSAQTVTGGFTVKNITINNTNGGVHFGTTSADTIFLTGKYTPTTGQLNTNGRLVLVSNASGTASVGEGSGAYVSGLVTVQRYHQNKRAWLLITAPLTTAGTTAKGDIKGNWQQQTYIAAPSYYTQYGLDQAANNTYGMLRWAASSWGRVTNTINDTSLFGNTGGSLADNKAFFLYVRGDRTINPVLGGTASTSVSLQAVGALQTGSKKFELKSTATYALVANPYAAPISLDAFLADNPGIVLPDGNTYFYYWDPNNAGSGGYTTATYNNGAWCYASKNGANAEPHYIQSGQAFFVTKNGQDTVVFNESQKSLVNNTNTVFSNGVTYGINVDMSKGTNYIDGILGMYNNNYSAAVIAPTEDAYKFWGNEEGISIIRSGSYLSVEARPEINAPDTMFLYLNKMIVGNTYKFDITGTNVPGKITGYLVDKYLNQTTTLNLATSSSFTFTIDTAAAAKSATRFYIVFNNKAPLSVSTIKIKATAKESAAVVSWTVATEKEVKNYMVERSTNGIVFESIHSTIANNSNNSSYSYTDNLALAGINYYRIKAINMDGTVQYSEVVKVAIGDKKEGISIYPNPVVGKTMHLQLNNLTTGIYTLTMFTADGQQVLEQNIAYTGESLSTTIQLPVTIATGIYQVNLSGTNKKFNEMVLVK